MGGPGLAFETGASPVPGLTGVNLQISYGDSLTTYRDATGLALAMAAKVVPGVDPTLMAIVPAKTYGVPANRGNRFRPGGRFVHLQQSRRLRLWLAGLAAGRSALLVTGGTRTGLA